MIFEDAFTLHLWLNHIPIVGSFFVIITYLYGWVRKKPDFIRFSSYQSVGISILYFFVFWSGKLAVEAPDLEVDSFDRITKHAVWAENLIGFQILHLLVSIWVLKKNHRLSRAVFILLTSLNCIALLILGHTGGQIRRPSMGNMMLLDAFSQE